MTIDERLEFLVKSTESLHASVQELHAESARRWEENTKRWEENEKRWERVRRVVRAALEAGFGDENGDN